MAARDVGEDDFKKDEEKHRDSIHISILENPALESHVEYKVIKASISGSGLNNLLANKILKCI
jgi:hypothetical protein